MAAGANTAARSQPRRGGAARRPLPVRVVVVARPGIVGGTSRLVGALGSVAEVVPAAALDSEAADGGLGGSAPDLILFEPGAVDRAGPGALDRLRARYPDARFAAFGPSDGAADARRLLRAGVHGYLGRESAPPVLRAAVELILAGGVYVPPCLVPDEIPAPASTGEAATDDPVGVAERHHAGERLRERERSLDAIAANLPGVVFRGVVEPDGRHRFTYISRNVERFAGVTPEQALADPERVFATIHPADRERHRRAVRERIANPDAPDHEFRIVGPDGAVRLLRSVATTRREADGRTVIDGIALDVTDQREAEARLAERERVLAALTDKLPAVVLRCVHGPDGSSRCAFIAGDVERLTGLTAEGVWTGRTPLSSCVHPDDRPAYLAAYDRAAAELAELDHEYRHVKPDGEVRWLRWIGRPSPGPGGDAYIDGVLFDVTEHRAALEALDRRNRELLALTRISEIALKSASLDAGLRGIVEEIGRFTGFDAVAIGLYDEERQIIDYRARRRFDSGRFGGGLRARIETTLVGEVVRTGRPLVERRCLERTGLRLTRMHKYGDQTFLGVPIRVGQRVIGSFHLTSQRDIEISPQMVELASGWADYIASFIASQSRGEVPALLGPERRSEAFEAAFACLTARQRDVLAQLAEGKPNKEIARALGLQEPTVKIHVGAILKALGVANRTQAAGLANTVHREPGRAGV